jgi:preprotein translocase subunit SecF
MAKGNDFGSRLYRGEVSYNIVGNRKRWYAVSAVFILISLASLGLRGLNLGIEFVGGAELTVQSTSCDVASLRGAVEAAGVASPVVTQVGGDRLRVTTPALTPAEASTVKQAVADECKTSAAEVDLSLVGPSWGGEITQKALIALVAFLVLVSIFLAIYFDGKMAVAALAALFHDIIITIGVYSLAGFEVTPSTVIGILTILGFSLYDTVVVFDKVKENTRNILGQSRVTYSEAANLALNQTLIRSMNTSIVALLPVAGILIVGVGILGAGTLKDLAIALFVGMAAGTYSSIFIATPVLCQLEERDPQMQALTKRVAQRSAKSSAPVDAGEQVAVVGAAGRPSAGSGPRNQPRRNVSRAKRR